MKKKFNEKNKYYNLEFYYLFKCFYLNEINLNKYKI